MQTLASLRQALARAAQHGLSSATPAGRRMGTGAAAVDAVLGGGLRRGALHEICAAMEGDAAAAAGFALGLAIRLGGGRPLVWVREDKADGEAGALYPPGLAAFGFDPARLIVMQARHAEAALRAGGEAVRCAGLGAVLMSLWGEPRLLDLTASRRLLLAAEKSGLPLLMIRMAARPAAGAAVTRWGVRALPSRALEANAPGFPSFAVTLQRQRGGACGHAWRLEWNHEQRCFAERDDSAALPALSRPLAALPAGTGDAAGMAAAASFRRAG